MTLEEAIIHCEEIAENKEQAVYDLIAFGYSNKEDRDECLQCAEEHRQLAEWLKELKIIHEIIDDMKDSEEIFIGYLRKKMKEKI